MAKDKKSSKAAAAPAPQVSKPLEAVKAGRVTKPIESAKAVAKETAKKAAELGKKSKKAKKEPSPEPSSDEDSEDENDTSDSSASSEDESEVEVEDNKAPKLNGSAKALAAKKDDSDSSDGSDSDESDDEPAPKQAAVAKANGATKAGKDDDSSSASGSDDEDDAPKVNGKKAATSDSEDDSEGDSDGSSDSESESDSEVETKAGAAKVNGDKKADVNGKADDDSSEASDSEDDEEEGKPKVAEQTGLKRKAEEANDNTPKKTKVMVNGEQKEPCANLFVGNLSFHVDEDWLTREFEEFGEIQGVRVITDRESGRSKGYGYVEFTSTDAAIDAIEAKQGAPIDGRNIRIDFSLPRPARGDNQTPQQRSFDRAARYGDTPKDPSKTLFVGNLSFDVEENMLTELFQDYPGIKAIRLPTDRESGQPKGYGYIEYTSIEESQAAFEAMQGAELLGRSMRLDYATERTNDSPSWSRGGRGGGFNDRGGRGGFGGRGGGRGGFNDRGGRGGRGGGRGRGGNSTNRGGFGDFSGKRISF